MADFDLSGYNTVPERIAEFREKHPEGCLRPANPDQPFTIVECGGTTFLAYTAAAYRSPDDDMPGIGTAWEPVPGPTKFTRNSELQNAETAAWGRAIIAVGAADAKKGIASREDIESRQAEAAFYAEQDYTPGLRTSVEAAIAKLDEDAKVALKQWFADMDLPAVRKMNGDQLASVIDHLMSAEPEAVPE